MADASAPNWSQSAAADARPRAPTDPGAADDPCAPAGADAPLAAWAALAGAALAGAALAGAAPAGAAPSVGLSTGTLPSVRPATMGEVSVFIAPKGLGVKELGPEGLPLKELVPSGLEPIELEPSGVVPNGFSPDGLDPMGLVPRVAIPKVGVPNDEEPSAVENGLFPDSMPGEDAIPVKPPPPAALVEASGGASVEGVEALARPSPFNVGAAVIGLSTPGLAGPPRPADGVDVGAPGTVPAGMPVAIVEAAADVAVGLEPGLELEPGPPLNVCAAIGPAARAASTAKIAQRGIRIASMASPRLRPHRAAGCLGKESSNRYARQGLLSSIRVEGDTPQSPSLNTLSRKPCGFK